MLQTLRSRLREIGMFKLFPRTLALSAVQRQAAASRSASPFISVQHGSTGGWPRVMLSRPLSTLAQTPSLRASLGHLAVAGLGFGVGLGLGLGFGLGEGQPQLPQAEIVVKKRMLRIKKMAKELVVLEPIVKFLFLLQKRLWCVCIGMRRNEGFGVAFIIVRRMGRDINDFTW